MVLLMVHAASEAVRVMPDGMRYEYYNSLYLFSPVSHFRARVARFVMSRVFEVRGVPRSQPW